MGDELAMFTSKLAGISWTAVLRSIGYLVHLKPRIVAIIPYIKSINALHAISASQTRITRPLGRKENRKAIGGRRDSGAGETYRA